MRTCVACREKKPKKDLVRILLNDENGLTVDLTGKKNGRGAYVCPSSECFAKARKTKAIERSLGVNVPEEIYERIGKELSDE